MTENRKKKRWLVYRAKVSVVITMMVILHWVMRNTSVAAVAQKTKWWVVGTICALLVIAIIISQKSGDSFIYFQF